MHSNGTGHTTYRTPTAHHIARQVHSFDAWFSLAERQEDPGTMKDVYTTDLTRFQQSWEFSTECSTTETALRRELNTRASSLSEI
jgi:hypothetical protein